MLDFLASSPTVALKTEAATLGWQNPSFDLA